MVVRSNKKGPASAASKIFTVTEVITPKKAETPLQSNTHNRALSAKRVEELAAQITSGNWVQNGQTIIVHSDGTLADGQHRLAAVVLANKSITTSIAYNVPKSAFATIDTGAKRQVKDVLYINGIGNSPMVAAATGVFWKMIQETRFTTVMPPEYALKVLERYPSIQAWCARYKNSAQIKSIIQASAIIPSLVYLTEIAKRDDLAERLFTGLAEGADLHAGDPVLALRNRLINYRSRAGAAGSNRPIHGTVIKVVDALEADVKMSKVHIVDNNGPVDAPKNFTKYKAHLTASKRFDDIPALTKYNVAMAVIADLG